MTSILVSIRISLPCTTDAACDDVCMDAHSSIRHIPKYQLSGCALSSCRSWRYLGIHGTKILWPHSSSRSTVTVANPSRVIMPIQPNDIKWSSSNLISVTRWFIRTSHLSLRVGYQVNPSSLVYLALSPFDTVAFLVGARLHIGSQAILPKQPRQSASRPLTSLSQPCAYGCYRNRLTHIHLK